MNLKDTDGALRDYNTAIELDPKIRVAYRNRGFLKIEMRQKDKGCLDFSKACKLRDRHALIQSHSRETAFID